MKKLIPKFVGLYLNLLTVVAPRIAGRKGFYFFCTPFGAKIKDHQLSFLNTSERITYSFENKSIQVYKWGQGKKVLLFLHGWQSHSFRWKNYIKGLDQQEYTIYALDAPAHGQSQGKYLNAVIYSRLVEKFIAEVGHIHTLISHSLGSMTTIYTLYRIPSLPVERVIITGMPAEVKNFVTYYKQVLGLWTRTTEAISKAFVSETGHPPEYFSMTRLVTNLSTPCLIIHDRDDPDAPYHDVVAVHQQWKNAQLITTENLGHNLRSPEVVKMVHDFISRKETVTV